MIFPIYTGSGKPQSDKELIEIPETDLKKLKEPQGYLPDKGLLAACNVALLLAQPLFLTGEPGTGKTQLAYNLAAELFGKEPIRFDTKSTSTAKDLFYSYDALRRFQDSQREKEVAADARNYITYQALGKAILKTRKRSDIEKVIPENAKHPSPMRSVVLIDEIDKAPRDFPNDLLNELESNYFRISEIDSGDGDDNKVETDSKFTPIVIITSNSEKDLPDAFLRRCIYYHIPFPDRDKLQKIIERRLRTMATENGNFVSDALNIFYKLRDSGLRKKPATAEFLAWLIAVREKDIDENSANPLEKLKTNEDLIERTLSILIKTQDDREKARKILRGSKF